ncbi:Rossmann-like and DUF2520 domain-containing protein [Fodinibius sp. Rm-B-1B1-1]|uniref:Rossmann-like and DUF2520 domain-containing protein n=1 Tax=Fodinibius alkaliphilus TaxID=3140241 RepID=UPI00315AA795
MPEITLIGTGGLGQTLVRALSEVNIPIKSIFNRTVDKARDIAVEYGILTHGKQPDNIGQLGNLIFITVTDRAIEEVAQQLSRLSGDFNDYTIVHCSGNESAELLHPLRVKGASVASFHPLQTFTEQSDAKAFQDIYFSLQGDKTVFPLLENIAQKLGAQTLEVTADQKSNLHAAAVMASNYLNTLLEAAIDTASLSGLSPERAKEALLPLVATTLRNIGEQSFENALTGPIKRGDIETVKRHIELLRGQPELMTIYQTLGKRTVALAKRSQKIDSPTAQTLLEVLA